MRWTLLVVLGACGRLDFRERAVDAATPDGATQHDEDGDGIPDSIDVCPLARKNVAD